MDFEEFMKRYEEPPTLRPVKQTSLFERITNMWELIKYIAAVVWWSIIGLMALGIIVGSCNGRTHSSGGGYGYGKIYSGETPEREGPVCLLGHAEKLNGLEPDRQ